MHSALLRTTLPVILSLAIANPATPSGDTPPARTVPIVVVHPDGSPVRRELLRTLDVWHDAGRFLVAEADDLRLQWLDGLDVDVLPLGEVAPGYELYPIEFTTEATLRRIEMVGGEVLFRYAPQALVALPPEAASILDALEPGSFMHHALMPIERTPRVKPRLFGPGTTTGSSRALDADPRVQAVVDQVDKNNVEATVQSLSSIYSRRCNLSGAVTAQNQLEAQLQGYGITTSLQNFNSSYSKNVVGEIPGAVDPDRIVVIGGHYDSINGGGSSLPAPGADDNASGTGGVMEAARVLAAGGPYRHTLRFIAFSGEELGLYGSAYAASLSDNLGENIVAMLNMDMIAYRGGTDTRDVDFISSNSDPDLIDFCGAMGALYVPGWASSVGVLMGGSSDHASYTNHGFPAVFVFEDAGAHCPYIHTANDSYPQATNDFDLAEMCVKGVVATAATLASPVDLLITHTPLGDTLQPGPFDVDCQVTSLIGSTVTSATINYSIDGLTYSQVPMTHQGGADWHGQIPLIGTPATVRYYIDALDDQGNDEQLPFGIELQEKPFCFFIGDKVPLYFCDFESGADGWLHGAISTQDDWQMGAPYGKEGDPSSAYSGSNIWGNDLGGSGWNGRYASNVENYLLSPVFDFTEESIVILEYQRWLVIEQAPYDLAEIRVNGFEVWQNEAGANHADTQWTRHTLDISDLAAGRSWVRVEFHLETNGSVETGGWNIDDFALYGLSGCPEPITYCTAMPNSETDGAEMRHFGSTSISANDFILGVEQGPEFQFGLFYYGPNQISVPYGEGLRCVGGGIYRLPVVHLDQFGNGTWTVDNTTPPDPAGQLEVGATWNFQFWYRDPAGGPSGFNFSDALQVYFCP